MRITRRNTSSAAKKGSSEQKTASVISDPECVESSGDKTRDFEEDDLVWARVDEDQPWWPALVVCIPLFVILRRLTNARTKMCVKVIVTMSNLSWLMVFLTNLLRKQKSKVSFSILAL
jgi:hypothetical protein